MNIRTFILLGYMMLMFHITQGKLIDATRHEVPWHENSPNKPESHTEKEEIEDFNIVESYVGDRSKPPSDNNDHKFDSFDMKGKKYVVLHNTVLGSQGFMSSTMEPNSDEQEIPTQGRHDKLIPLVKSKNSSPKKESSNRKGMVKSITDTEHDTSKDNSSPGQSQVNKKTVFQTRNSMQHDTFKDTARAKYPHAKLRATKAPLKMLLIDKDQAFELKEHSTIGSRAHQSKEIYVQSSIDNKFEPEKKESLRFAPTIESTNNQTNATIHKIGLLPRLTHFFVYHPVLTGFFIAIDIVLLVILIAVIYVCLSQQCQKSPDKPSRWQPYSPSLEELYREDKPKKSTRFPRDSIPQFQSDSSSDVIESFASLEQVVVNTLQDPQAMVDVDDSKKLQNRSVTTGLDAIDNMLTGRNWPKSTFQNVSMSNRRKTKAYRFGNDLKISGSQLSIASLTERIDQSTKRAEKIYQKQRRQ